MQRQRQSLDRGLHWLSGIPFGKSFDSGAWGQEASVDRRHEGQRMRMEKMKKS